ncbi:serine hydrolase domain-containing protein [Aquabacterium humicola]|uniref:serine hydrolase domain-containing protein n=1 Tax=Aquabacterium humicola TaxID=3237377 RepID=UPI0025437025|nr:serine hydrolase domain-containing protein [Rubrivivax pictus]
MRLVPCAVGLFALCAACTTAPPVQPLPMERPAMGGLSTAQRTRIATFLERMQQEGKVAGTVALVARRGRIVLLSAHGFADLESRRAIRVDDLFHLQSMSKPIATVAALQLMERGLLRLSDPVARFLPAFSDLRVAVDRPGSPGQYELVAALRPITIGDLLTHRAGFVGLPPRDTAAARLQREAAKALPPHQADTLDQYVTHLAALPLDAQPGTDFRYGPATIVLGRIIEVITGQTLDVALHEQIFRPLGMTDTFFTVPEAKRGRVVSPYALRPGRGLVRVPLDPMPPRFLSAAGNLYGTPTDYLRFCQMLLNGGELDSVRILSRQSVELMTTPQVHSIPLPFLPGHAFGLGVAIRKDDPAAWPGTPGTYGWSGGYNTYFRIDPREQVVFALFAQLVFSPVELELQRGFHDIVVQALH